MEFRFELIIYHHIVETIIIAMILSAFVQGPVALAANACVAIKKKKNGCQILTIVYRWVIAMYSFAVRHQLDVLTLKDHLIT